jgi:hypothetical protein
MPNSILQKFEGVIVENRRRMIAELDDRCTERLHIAIDTNYTAENWKLYHTALVDYYRAILSKQDDNMFELLNFSSSRKKLRRSNQSRKSISSSL